MRCQHFFRLLAASLLQVTTTLAHDGSLEEECNTTSPRPQPRIVGGTPVTKVQGSYPYVVDLDTVLGEHVCMGALVASDLVLCAAHCGDAIKLARVGRYNKTDSADGSGSFLTTNKWTHPLYYDRSTEFDFKLLLLNGHSDSILLRLNTDPELPQDGQALTIVGFGSTEATNHSSGGTVGQDSMAEILQEAVVNAISNEECNKFEAPDFTYQGRVTSDMLCAKDNQQDMGPQSDTCHGDSGAPLILKGSNSPNDDLQVGIVSWGAECAGRFPGVYSRISAGYDWIRSIVCAESADPPLHFACDNSATYPPLIEDAVEFVFEFTVDEKSSKTNVIFLDRIEGFNMTRAAVARSELFPENGVYRSAVFLQKEKLHSLALIDDDRDGVKEGGVKLFLRDTGGSLVQIQEVISGELTDHKYFVTLFYATLEEPEWRYDDDKTFPNGSFLSLKISFDQFPHEIGVELRFSNGTLLFYRPPGYYYSFVNGTATEKISVPAQLHNYTLSVADTYGDGLGNSTTTGFTLDDGNNQLLSDPFETGKEKVLPFSWPLPDGAQHPLKKDVPDDENKDSTSKLYLDEEKRGNIDRRMRKSRKLKG